jgi:hypothetical protein
MLSVVSRARETFDPYLQPPLRSFSENTRQSSMSLATTNEVAGKQLVLHKDEKKNGKRPASASPPRNPKSGNSASPQNQPSACLTAKFATTRTVGLEVDLAAPSRSQAKTPSRTLLAATQTTATRNLWRTHMEPRISPTAHPSTIKTSTAVPVNRTSPSPAPSTHLLRLHLPPYRLSILFLRSPNAVKTKTPDSNNSRSPRTSLTTPPTTPRQSVMRVATPKHCATHMD